MIGAHLRGTRAGSRLAGLAETLSLLLVLALVVAVAPPSAHASEPATKTPRVLTTDGVGCLAPDGDRVFGATPVLAGVPGNGESTVRAEVELRAMDAAENLQSWRSDAVATGEPVSWQVGTPLLDGRYRWRMRSMSADTTTVSGWSGWCEFAVDTTLDDDPEPEPAPDLECPVPAGEPLAAEEESIALSLARACDAPAEVLSLRDYTVQVMAQPDGTLLAEQFSEPQWVPDGDGGWTEVDPSFEVAEDGRIATAAAVSEIEVSPGGGTAPLLKATDPDGGWMSLSWPGELPAPVIDGPTVTYPDVLPDVDLRVTGGIDGFSYSLAVKSAAGAANPELASVELDVAAGGGLSLGQDADGAVIAEDSAGEAVFTAPAAYMWDASEPPAPLQPLASPEVQEDREGDEQGSGDPTAAPPGAFTQMPVELRGDTLTVEPDQALLTDPSTEFPVVIDPPFTGKRVAWATVHKQQRHRGWTNNKAWPRRGGMRIGNLQWWPGYPCGDACGVWRSAVKFNVKGLEGKQIVSAKVKAVQTHTSGCGSYGLRLHKIGGFGSGASWNGIMDDWWGLLQTKSPPSSNRSGGCSGTEAEGITFGNSNVRDAVRQRTDAGRTYVSFGFRSTNESSKNPYRRIRAGSVRLEVVYNSPARKPRDLEVEGKNCDRSEPGPWLSTRRPTLSGKPRDPDGRVGAEIRVYERGPGGVFYKWTSGKNRKANKVVNHRVRRGDKLPSGNYRWRMRSLDNYRDGDNSDWRQWCYFQVDATSPTIPKIELVGDPPTAGEDVTVRLTSSDEHSGLAGFSYGVNEERKQHSVSSSGTATITFPTSPEGGRNWVYVWSRDEAGNYSNRAVFDVFAARFVEATPAAAWRLNGDGLDDTGNGHELLLGSGVTWEDDAGPPADTSLGFDGTGCVATEGTVVRLDAEYTVAAWVRLDTAAGTSAVMAPAGRERPGFSLRYSSDHDDTWIFALGSTPDSSASPTWAALRSAEPAKVGEWTHLAVRVDPAARHMQMFVDGEFSAERTIPFVPWHEDGPMQVGCSGPGASGGTWGHFHGAIHHVGVWQGLLTPAQIRDAYEGELPAGPTGDWPLRGDGEDTSAFARDLQVSTDGTTWVEGPFGRQRSGLRLDGAGWAGSAGSVVRTDQSFSVAVWAKLDDKSSYQTVMGQAGDVREAFKLSYDPAPDRWQMGMPSADHVPPGEVDWHKAMSDSAPEVGRWYHLVGVYDHADNRIRLYVDGELQSSAAGPDQPWHADGPLLVGASGVAYRINQVVGSVSRVQTWRGALTGEQVAEVYGGNPAVELRAEWGLGGSGADSAGGHTLTFVGAEGVDYEWVENRFCIPWQALGLRVNGEAYAHTDGPVLTTDESYTVATWVKLDAVIDEHQTMLAQAHPDGRAAFLLQATPEGSWRMSMPQHENGESEWVGAESEPGTVEPGIWTHVAGVFDLPKGEARLYVDGELAATGPAPDAPWHADGPFYIGTGKPPGSTMFEPVHGDIDAVRAYSSVLHEGEIARLGRPLSGGGLC